jgi:hypothetical protein
MEMTLRHLLGSQPDIDHTDFLARADALGSRGQTVMISNYSRFHSVATYLRRYTTNSVGLVLGVPTLAGLFEEKHYADLPGGILEAFGHLFGGDLRLYVYPWQNPGTREIVTADNFRPPPHLQHLYAHLRANNRIASLA